MDTGSHCRDGLAGAASDRLQLIELAENAEQKAILEFITKTAIVGRPFAVGSGVPKERVL